MKSTNERNHPMEELLGNFGASLDELIEQARALKEKIVHGLTELKKSQEESIHRTKDALSELRNGIDAARTEMTMAWDDVRAGAERAAQRLSEKHANADAAVKDDTTAEESQENFCTTAGHTASNEQMFPNDCP